VPDHPPTAVGPTDPQGPGGGATGPTGPATPRNGICTEPANAGVVDPNDVHDPRNYRDNPTSAAIAGDGEIMPMSAGIYTGGPGAMGSAVTDPRIPLGRLSGLDPWTREPERVPGLVERIGGADRDSVGLYSILHPMQEGFAAMVFRPQLTVQGYPHFEHNPQVPPGMIERDEAVRPQVLAMRAWGSQSASTGDWSYVEPPMSSRARGGTGHGGILFSPPRFELEDYLGINTGANVEDVTGTRARCGVRARQADGDGLTVGEGGHALPGLLDGNQGARHHARRRRGSAPVECPRLRHRRTQRQHAVERRCRGCRDQIHQRRQ
jgi:hypothetical protein